MSEVRPPVSARRERMENEIYEQASKLFAERGFAGTSLQDIAEAMGVTRPSLYYYVKSKDELLARLVTEITEGPAAEIKALAEDPDADPVAKLRDIARLIALRRAREPARFLLLVRSEAELSPALAKAHKTAMRSTLHSLIKVIDQGVVAGRFRPVEPRTTALAVTGMCNWVAWWHSPGEVRPGTEVADQLADLAVAMVERAGHRTPDVAGPRAALALLREDLDYLERVLED